MNPFKPVMRALSDLATAANRLANGFDSISQQIEERHQVTEVEAAPGRNGHRRLATVGTKTD